MTLKTIILIPFLIFIEFSTATEVNNEHDNTPSLTTNIQTLTQLTQETLIRLRYVHHYWQEIPIHDQNMVEAYHQLLKRVANEINRLPLTAQQITKYQNVLRPRIQILNAYLINVVSAHQQNSALRAAITRELSQLGRATRQLIENGERVHQYWHKLPDGIKNEIRQLQQQIMNVVQRTDKQILRGPVPYKSIIENRNAYLQPVQVLGYYYGRILQYLNQQHLERQSLVGQAEHRGPQNQGILRLSGTKQSGLGGQSQLEQEYLGSGKQEQVESRGQKRRNNQEQGGSGGKRNTNESRLPRG